MDQSGQKTYRFNSLGFRGEEFNPDSKFHLFVFGPSSSFVTGLDLEETYGYQLKCRIAKNQDWRQKDINFMNFAVAGVSTDYSVRNLINQCSDKVPDLVILDLSHRSRMEWITNKGTGTPFGSGIPGTPMNYFQFYEDELGCINLLKNLLLMQYFCQSKNIDYLVLNMVLDLKTLPKSGPLKDYLEKIDLSKIVSLVNIEALDSAADTRWNPDGSFKWRGHFGPKTNKQIAETLHLKYQGE